MSSVIVFQSNNFFFSWKILIFRSAAKNWNRFNFIDLFIWTKFPCSRVDRKLSQWIENKIECKWNDVCEESGSIVSNWKFTQKNTQGTVCYKIYTRDRGEEEKKLTQKVRTEKWSRNITHCFFSRSRSNVENGTSMYFRATASLLYIK